MITFQFMEAIQSEFWEASFKPKSTSEQNIVLPLTKKFFHHPAWFSAAEADGVIDLRNIKLLALFVHGNRGATLIIRDIEAWQAEPEYGYIPPSQAVVTPSLTETGRCANK